MAEWNIKEVGENAAKSVKKLFSGKKGKYVLIGGAALVIVVFFIYNRNKSGSEYDTATIAGYPEIGAGGGSGGSGGSEGSGVTSDDLSNLADQFGDQLDQITRGFTDIVNRQNEAIAGLENSYTNQFAGMKGLIDGMNAEFAKRYQQFELERNSLLDKISAFSDRSNYYGAESGYGSPYSDWNMTQAADIYDNYGAKNPDGSTKLLGSSQYTNRITGQTTYVPSGKSVSDILNDSSSLQKAKQAVYDNSNYSQQTKQYISGIVSGNAGSIQNAADTAARNEQKLKEVQERLKANPPKFTI